MTELAVDLGEPKVGKSLSLLTEEELLTLADEAQGDAAVTPGSFAFGYGDAKELFGIMFHVLKWLGALLLEGKKIKKEFSKESDALIETRARETLIATLREHRISEERAILIAEKYARRLRQAVKLAT